MHEYAVAGHARERIIFYVSVASVFLAPFLTAEAIKILHLISYNVVSFSIGSATVFAVLFGAFNIVVWKIGPVRVLLGMPDLNGEWICEGHAIDHETKKEYDWSGTLHISQTWTRMLVTLKTNESKSVSTSAIGGLLKLPGESYVLSLVYENKPSMTQKSLHQHAGLCRLVFNLQRKDADGQYFNNGTGLHLVR